VHSRRQAFLSFFDRAFCRPASGALEEKFHTFPTTMFTG
jgi:hypothetical protein